MTVDNDGDDGGDSGERGRGIITPADREYLQLSEEEREENYSQSARIQRRNAIADRIENALLDFPYLARHVNDETLHNVFGPQSTTFDFGGEPIGGVKIPQGKYGVPFGLWFLLRIQASGVNQQPLSARWGVMSNVKPFLEQVERGIELWLNQHDMTGEVDVDISVSHLQSSEELAEQLEAAEEPLTGRERIEIISQLGRTGYSTDEIAEILGEEVPVDEDSGDGS